MKGISFNVTLSEDQIEEIAQKSAEKVKDDRSYFKTQEEFSQREIVALKSQLQQCHKILFEKELSLDRTRRHVGVLRKKLREYKEILGELE